MADQVERLSIGSTFSRINVATIRELLVPDDFETHEAQALGRVKAHFGHTAKIETILATVRARLAEYRDALITEAVTGQLDVTAASDRQMDERLHEAIEQPIA